MKKLTPRNGDANNSKPARTGFRVVVHDSISRFPVANTKITFYPGGRSVVTKLKGMCFIELDEGTYSYIVKAPGFPQVEGTAVITPGVMQLVYVKLERAKVS